MFEYCSHKLESMTGGFRVVVGCGLRARGRRYAARAAEHSETNEECAAARAWAAPVPPSYHEATTEAALEAADLAASADRPMELSDDADDNDGSMIGYLEVTATN